MNDINVFETTNEYWECNCVLHYVHKTDLEKQSDQQYCEVCGFTREDGCDARVDDVNMLMPNVK